MLDKDVQVQTPEHVQVRLKLAGMGSRAIAQLIDLCILAVFYILLTVSEVLWSWMNVFGLANSYLIGAVIVVCFLIFWGYFIALETSLSGQTLGKRILHIRCVQKDGRPLSFYASALRNLLRIIDFLPVGYFVGVVSAMIDKAERRIGDLAAGTIVVQDGFRMRLPMSFDTQDAKWSGQTRTAAQLDATVIVSVRRVPVQLEIDENLPAEWRLFLLDIRGRMGSLSKARRADLIPELWTSFTSQPQVRVALHSTVEAGRQLPGEKGRELPDETGLYIHDELGPHVPAQAGLRVRDMERLLRKAGRAVGRARKGRSS